MSGFPRRFWAGVLFATILFVASARAQVSFSVLGYNIHRDIGGSDSNVSAQAALAQVVNYLNPDVWTINELGGNGAGFSRSLATTYLTDFVRTNLTIFGASPQLGVDYFVYVSSINDGYETNAIVSRYPILAAQSFSDAGGGSGALRGLTYALVDLPGTLTDVGVFTMHLKALDTASDAARRQAEADANATRIATWMGSNPDYAVVVSGDWNESEDVADGTNWDGHAIGDPITLANGRTEAYHPVSTILSAGLTDPIPVSASGDNDTISASNPDARFDYVTYGDQNLAYVGGQVFNSRAFTSAQLAAMNAASGLSLARGTSAGASDHLPVLAVFAVIPEPATAPLLGASLLLVGILRRFPTKPPRLRGPKSSRPPPPFRR